MMFWFREHRHYWVPLDRNPVKTPDGQQYIAMVVTYRCYRCGSLRYDKIDGDGFVRATIVDSNGAITKATTECSEQTNTQAKP